MNTHNTPTQGLLTLSYMTDAQDYTLNCGTVISISDNIKADVLQTPIPVYSADDAFTFDTGSTEVLHFKLIRRNPVPSIDPQYTTEPDSIPDIYDMDWDSDSTKWSNRIWKMALISMIDRWQMKTDGIQVVFTPLILSNESDYESGVFQETIDIRGYLQSLSITYDINSFETLHIDLDVAVGSMHRT